MTGQQNNGQNVEEQQNNGQQGLQKGQQNNGQ